ncbi:hypothetical protein PIROE2DRAFT_12935 [Piromyces sp. E2]|nr:hypothetical protein PIROE2DRAFT_12935 [Piromyces sp. E2]|eukprot:OUM61137.1 hypothetical protein PIROE2DRAFT_12935 [Piromyces sp. E2]
MEKKSKGPCNVVTTKLSHESLMLSFNEFLTSDPMYGNNVKFLFPIDMTSALLITLDLRYSNLQLQNSTSIICLGFQKPHLNLGII